MRRVDRGEGRPHALVARTFFSMIAIVRIALRRPYTFVVLALLILICLGASVLGWTTRGIEGVPDSQIWLRSSGILQLAPS